MTIYYSTNDHDSVDHIPEDYDRIVKQSQELLKQIAGDEMKQIFNEMKQILILQTADNKVYKAIVDWSSDPDAAEQALINTIEKKDTIVRLVCRWENGAFDMPTYHFREKLCELNPNNLTAQMLLSGERTFILKTIRETFPKSIRETFPRAKSTFSD